MIKNEFLNKKVFITGASGFIGQALCRKYSQMGCELILTDKNLKKLQKLSNYLKKKYKVKIFLKSCDLNNIYSIKKLNKEIKKKFKNIDIFIHNAANTGSSKNLDRSTSFESQRSDYWDDSINVNLKSSFEILKNIYKIMNKSKNPSVVNISSIYGIVAPDWKIYEKTKIVNPAVYSVSKSGLNQFTKWQASYLSPKIRVNSVSPGGVLRGQNKKFLKKYISKTLLKRMATEEDVVNAVVFLSSEMSSYITGHNLVVDGGYTTT